MKKKKKGLNVNVILVVLLVVVILVMFYSIFNIYNSIKKSGSSEVEVLDTIDTYNYQLDENDSPYFEKLYNELKDELNKEEVDEEKYAELVSKLFVVDFYSLEYAINKNDVGGKQFVFSDYQDSFILKAKDSIYKYVENNIYGKRTQELSNVSNVVVTSIESVEASFDNNDSENSIIVEDDNAYEVTLELEYDVDYGYPTECVLTLVHNNNKLEVASLE